MLGMADSEISPWGGREGTREGHGSPQLLLHHLVTPSLCSLYLQ